MFNPSVDGPMRKKLIIQEIHKLDQPQSFTVSKKEHLTIILLATQAANYTLQVKLTGVGAEADILGIVLGNDAFEVRINTLQDHQAPNTTSNLLIKSALSGRSKLFYEGFIKVQKNAQKTNAYQRNENLMLSTDVKAESKPALEILANDVRCTHSATIGKVDPELMYYLQSRGIGHKKATALIVTGFFQPVLDKIMDAGIRKQIVQKVETLLIERSVD